MRCLEIAYVDMHRCPFDVQNWNLRGEVLVGGMDLGLPEMQ